MLGTGGSSSAAGHSDAAPTIICGKYEVGRLVGCGSSAKVYHARHLPTGQSVALKILSKTKLLKSGLSGIVRREIGAMRRVCRHPHVVGLLEAIAFRSRIVLVLEFARGGELFSRLHSRGRLPEESARRLFLQLLSAVSFCHSRGVFHRDLKPENILLDDKDRLKVSDFGLSAFADPVRSHGRSAIFRTICGTPAYVAPEILLRRPYDAAKADMWSCGVILYVLAAGYLPFNDTNIMALYRKICRGEFSFPKWFSPPLRNLVSRLLDVDPDTRITVDGVAEDAWLRLGISPVVIGSALHFRPEVETKFAKFDSDDATQGDMNAFDLIGFAPGLDLSGLFESSGGFQRRFVVEDSASAVLQKVEHVGKEAGMVVRKKEKGSRWAAAVQDKTGDLVAWVELNRLSRDFIVVHVETLLDWTDDVNGAYWPEKLRRALLVSPI